MSTAEAKTRYSPEDLLALPDEKNHELVDGELVERNMGCESSWIGGRLHHFLSAYCDAKRLGVVFPADSGYQCFPDAPEKVRKPDVSFISVQRLAPDKIPAGHCLIAPDLAVEVVSPNDFYYDVEAKVAEYLEAGVRLIWVVNPPTRSIRVHRKDGTVTDLEENEELNGQDVIPGFHCRVGDLFAFPAPPGEEHE